MIQFKVIQSGNQVETQSKSATAIPVFFRDYPKYLQIANHVFNDDSFSRQLPICSFLFFRQLRSFGFFGRCLTVFVFLFQTLITGIAQAFNLFPQSQPALFEKFKIVRFAFRLTGAKNLPRLFINHDLRLYRVPLFLARIISALFFFGRSIIVSVASTTITSKIFPLVCKTFLPGKRKSGQRLRISSILRIIRHTVGSLKFQELAIWNCVRYSRQYSKVSNTWSSIQ